MNTDVGNGSPSSIRNWPRAERPREILFDKGVDYVSDAGLLAILLQSGIHGKDAIALARELLSTYHGLRGLFRQSPSNLMRVKGLGMAKIARLIASVELARRCMNEEIVGADYFDPNRDLLDAIKSCIKDSAVVYPREVIRTALDLGASGIIFIHNHPCGSIEPSEEDRETARKLSVACRSVDIDPIDHLIFSNNTISKIII
jgi:DNA repair protein RadC